MLMHLIDGILLILTIGLYGNSCETVIRTHPESQAVLLGDDLMLHCVAEMAEPGDGESLHFHWELNGFATAQIQQKSSMFSNHSLFVPRVTQSDLGSYQCLVETVGPGQNLTTASTVATVVLAFIRPFALHPESLLTNEGQAATLQCVTGRGAPPPHVYWEKDGSEYLRGYQETVRFGSIGEGASEQLTMRLELSNAEVSDSGIYRCVAYNIRNGDIYKSNAAVLDVIVPFRAPYLSHNPPRFLQWTASLPAEIECPIIAHPRADITWYKDDQALMNDSRTQIKGTGELVLSNVQRDDMGSYKCQGENMLGRISTPEINITVAYLETDFLVEPSDTEVLAGQNVILLCSPPLSFPPAAVTWYKDDVQIPEREGEFSLQIDDAGNLHFSNIQREDEGVYICVATNDLAIPVSRSSRAAKIEIGSAPTIIQSPIAQRVIKGQLLELSCVIIGKPDPLITWFKDGNIEISTLQSSRFDLRNRGRDLLINDVNKADEANYHCQGSNKYGTTASPGIFIRVLVSPVIVEEVQDETVIEGRPVFLSCEVYGDPIPHVMWFQDGTLLDSEDSNFAPQSNGLQIGSASRDGAGTYTCSAQNEAGSRNSSGVLTVHVPPEFHNAPEDTTVNQTFPIALYCGAFGIPAVTLSWTFNGYPELPDGVVVSLDRSTLIIEHAQVDQTGVYRCSAQNELGAVQQAATLFVQVKPTIIEISTQHQIVMDKHTINKGDDLSLVCKVNAIPNATISWYYKNTKIIETSEGRVSFPTENSLSVRFTSADDMGSYRCVARNPVGSDSKEVFIFVQDILPPPQLISAVANSKRSILLSWVPPSLQEYETLTGYNLQYKHSASLVFLDYTEYIQHNDQHVEIQSLEPASEYHFQIASVNDVGIGTYSNILVASTLEAAPSAPKNMRLVSQSSESITLQWETPLIPNGEIKLYQLMFSRKDVQNDTTQIEIPAVADQPSHTFAVSNLTPFTTYEFKCRAANVQDGQRMWGDFSLPLEATTSATVPSGTVEFIQARALSSRSIHVSWQSISPESINGPLEGYVIKYQERTSYQVSSISATISSNEITISDLLPWRYYDAAVQAFNNQGEGPISERVSVQTLPEAPIGSPTNMQIQPLSSQVLQISWQGVPDHLQNSDISGYIVEYIKDTSTFSQYVGNPETLTVNISDLQPWTLYRVRVQAFTTQVSNGFGPFTEMRSARTLQDVPSVVEDITIEAFSKSIVLSWQEPLITNGIIMGYIILYDSINVNKSVGNETLLDVDTPMKKLLNISQGLSITSGEIKHLVENTEYYISIAAWTAAGIGPYTNRSVLTALASTEQTTVGSDTTEVPSYSVEPSITSNNETIKSPQIKHNVKGSNFNNKELIGLIVGCVVFCICVLLLICIVAYMFLKGRRRKNQENLFYSRTTFPVRYSTDPYREQSIPTKPPSYDQSSSISSMGQRHTETARSFVKVNPWRFSGSIDKGLLKPAKQNGNSSMDVINDGYDAISQDFSIATNYKDSNVFRVHNPLSSFYRSRLPTLMVRDRTAL